MILSVVHRVPHAPHAGSHSKVNDAALQAFPFRDQDVVHLEVVVQDADVVMECADEADNLSTQVD